MLRALAARLPRSARQPPRQPWQPRGGAAWPAAARCGAARGLAGEAGAGGAAPDAGAAGAAPAPVAPPREPSAREMDAARRALQLVGGNYTVDPAETRRKAAKNKLLQAHPDLKRHALDCGSSEVQSEWPLVVVIVAATAAAAAAPAADDGRAVARRARPPHQLRQPALAE